MKIVRFLKILFIGCFFLIILILIGSIFFVSKQKNINFGENKIIYLNNNLHIQHKGSFSQGLIQSGKIEGEIIYLKYYYPYLDIEKNEIDKINIYDKVSYQLIGDFNSQNQINIDSRKLPLYIILTKNNFSIFNKNREILYGTGIDYNIQVFDLLDKSNRISLEDINYESKFKSVYEEKDDIKLILAYDYIYEFLKLK